MQMNSDMINDTTMPPAQLPRRSWLRLVGWSLCLIAFGASLAIILRLVPRSVVPVVFATGGFGIVLLWVRNKWWLGTLLGAICSLAGAAMAELFVPVDGEGKILLGHILGAVSGVWL